MSLKKKSNESKLQILSNGFMSSTKSCLLIFDSNRYLINCGEGTLRCILHNNLKPSKIDNILLTRFDWSFTGGLNGLSKELEEFQNKITLHSGYNFNLNNAYSIKKYYFEKKFKIIQHNYSNEEQYTDENVSIKKIDFNKTCSSYLFTIKKSEPNLLVDKLSKYDVKPGPWIKDLKNGIEYKLANGDLIKPQDVLDFTNCEEKKIIFLDCLDLNELEMIKTSESINQSDMLLIVHFANSNIINHESYLNWIKNYTNQNCIHLYLDENYPNIDLLKIYEIQAQLNLIDNNVFKLLPVQLNSFSSEIQLNKQKQNELQKSIKLIQAQTNMIFNLKSNLNLDLRNLNEIKNEEFQKKILNYYENEPKFKIDGIDSEEKLILDNFRLRIEQFNEQKQIEERKNLVEQYPNILFLGTASALPASTRNVTAIYVKIDSETSILLDCGEGTCAQMNKYFGNEKLDSELVQLSLIFISHYHLDHFNGLYGLILKRIKAFEKLKLKYKKLKILIPSNFFNHLKGSNLILNNLNELVDLIPNNYFLKGNYKLNLTGLKSIETVLVKHIYQSFGVCLNLENNFKLVYSGDCRPSNELAEVGKNCDLLIHECTFDNAFKDEAVKKFHSTISEALSVSSNMNAKSTVLTHFSLRYGKIANLDDINKPSVGVAFDFMNINPSNISKLDELLKYIKVAFKEHADEIEIKKAKKLKL